MSGLSGRLVTEEDDLERGCMLLFGMLAAVGCSQGTNAIALTPEADAPVAVSLASAKPIYTAAGEGADGATPLKSPNSIRVDYKLTVKEKAPSGAAVFAKIACNVGDYVLSTPYTPEVELDKHAAGEEISESISFGYWMGHPVLSSMPEVCEVSFRYKGVKNDPSTYKSLGKACYTKESLSNGPCADELLKRKKSGAGPVTIEKLEARVVEQTSGADKGKPALDGLLVATLHKELRPTSNKELGAGVLAKAACRTETKDLPRSRWPLCRSVMTMNSETPQAALVCQPRWRRSPQAATSRCSSGTTARPTSL